MSFASVTIKDRTFKPLISGEKLAAAVTRIAGTINRELASELPVFLVVLNGSFMFAADLLKEVKVPCEISFIKLASYSGTSSSGSVKELLGLDTDIAKRTVVIVEDIVDSGLTIETLREQLSSRNVGSIKVATLLFKPASYKKSVLPDYVGFEIGEEFVVGYGMDYDGQGRNLKEVYVSA